jgi:NTE family protein
MNAPVRKDPVDLVLQGGGVKGVALGGALDVLLEGFEVRRVAGTSAGAIAASLVAAGYDRDELREAMDSLPYEKVPDRAPNVPGLGELAGLVTADGLYRGDFIERWVAEKLAAKGVETFGHLRLPPDEAADPHLTSGDRHYKLVVTATDVTRGRGLRLPWDYRDAFGLEPDEQSVAAAVRMSLSIPVFFRPCTLVDEDTKVTSRIVDGGVLSNFPVELFDRQDGKRPRWPTLGVGIIPDLPGADGTLFPELPIRLVGPLQLVEATIATAISGHDQTYLAQPRNAERVFRIDTGSVGVVDFDIDARRRRELAGNGARAATRFLAGWDWDAYLKRFYP